MSGTGQKKVSSESIYVESTFLQKLYPISTMAQCKYLIMLLAGTRRADTTFVNSELWKTQQLFALHSVRWRAKVKQRGKWENIHSFFLYQRVVKILIRKSIHERLYIFDTILLQLEIDFFLCVTSSAAVAAGENAKCIRLNQITAFFSISHDSLIIFMQAELWCRVRSED